MKLLTARLGATSRLSRSCYHADEACFGTNAKSCGVRFVAGLEVSAQPVVPGPELADAQDHRSEQIGVGENAAGASCDRETSQ